jgi:hypothetical protein
LHNRTSHPHFLCQRCARDPTACCPPLSAFCLLSLFERPPEGHLPICLLPTFPLRAPAG